MTWANTTTGQSGTITGSLTPTWSVSQIPIASGTNQLQVTATGPNNTALVLGTAANYGGTESVNLPFTDSPSTNVALNKTVTVSSTDGSANAAAYAVDGNPNTRWSSAYSDPQWIEVDLGNYYSISEIDINWEAACGKNYLIQTSNDNVSWTTQNSVTNNTTAGLLAYKYSSGITARYVRMYGTARATSFGYSIYEFIVYSGSTVAPPPPPPPAATNLALDMPVTVSSVESASYPGANAVDGDTTTRWASAWSDPQWIEVDLGSNFDISEVDLTWEAACGKNYQIQTSSDNVNWTAQTTVTNNATSGLLTYTYATPVPSVRYVRMYGTAPRDRIRLLALRVCRLWYRVGQHQPGPCHH